MTMTDGTIELALDGALAYRGAARASLVARLASRSIDADQRAAHGFAWVATSVAALEAVLDWARGGQGANPLDGMVARLAFAETLGQLVGGLPMSQNELLRPSDLGIADAARTMAAQCEALLDADHTDVRAELAHALAEGRWPSESLRDPELDAIREQFRRFTDAEILPHAHKWHLANALIPDATVKAMADLGTFGVCVPEAYGGLGLTKLVMCLVTEELSRGWIGAGSLGTRSEIAGELIMLGGTEAQKADWLPRIAIGEVAAGPPCFTEPDVGSDLGSLQDPGPAGRQRRMGDRRRQDLDHPRQPLGPYDLAGAHRSGREGLCGTFHAAGPSKPRGVEADLFPAGGMSGSEIEVLGYRGMREYTLQFDGIARAGVRPARRRGGAGVQTADAHLRGRAHPDGGARRGCRTARPGAGARLCAEQKAVRQGDRRLSTRRRQAGGEPRRPGVGARADLCGGPCERPRQALRHRGGHGQSFSPRAPRGRMPTPACRSTAATAMRSNTRSAGCSAMRASSNIFEGAAEIQAQVIARGLIERRN